MEIAYGSEVIDRNGKALGTVDHLVHNTWTGEVSKFLVRRKDKGLFFSPQDVLEVTEFKIRVNISLDELSGNTQI